MMSGRWLAMVSAAMVTTACGLMPTGTPRDIIDTEVRFTPIARDFDSITSDAAAEAMRDEGAPVGRPFEAEYGVATCEAEAFNCFFGAITPAGRTVWLIEWEQRSGRAWGLVDAATGEVIVISAVAE
jgi:hypothetical protein